MALEKPAFMRGTNSWMHNGYFFESQPPLADLRQAGNENPLSWMGYAWALEGARHGDFSGISHLAQILPDIVDEGLEHASFQLLGDAGSRSELAALTQELSIGHRKRAALAARNLRFVGLPDYVPNMLDAWRRAKNRDDHVAIAFAISALLEPVGGPVADLAHAYDRDPEALAIVSRRASPAFVARCNNDEVTSEFVRVVQEAISKVEEQGLGTQSLWYGELASARVVWSELERLINGSGAPVMTGFVIDARRKLEALTGWNFSHFFKQGVFQPLAAQAALEDFAENVDMDAAIPGKRYFFGHPVPD